MTGFHRGLEHQDTQPDEAGATAKRGLGGRGSPGKTSGCVAALRVDSALVNLQIRHAHLHLWS